MGVEQVGATEAICLVVLMIKVRTWECISQKKAHHGDWKIIALCSCWDVPHFATIGVVVDASCRMSVSGWYWRTNATIT
jgi:hypothetical protein